MFSFGSSKSSEENKKDSLTKEERKNVDEIFKQEESDSKKKKTFDGFDPTGLERAAKAARELQDLKYAPEAINIAKEQEKTKRMEAQKSIEENKARQKAFEIDRIREAEQQRRETLKTDAQYKQQQANYQDQLARRRHQDQLQAQRAFREEEIRKQEESQRRIEALKRQTAEYEATVKKQVELAKVEAESKGRTEQERKNWDLHIQRTKLEQREFRTTVLEGIREAGTVIGNGISEFISDKEKVTTTIGAITLAALGIYTARSTTRVVGNLIERRLSQPPLVRETSKFSAVNFLRSPFKTLSARFGSAGSGTADPKRVMENIILESTVQQRLERFVNSTANSVRNNSPFRNLMLYGAPGTGKTLFAKQLAKRVNMNYAILAGSDVLPLGKQGVSELHKLFDWAESSSKGLVLFVDEAEAFLRKRTDNSTGTMSEEARNALNAFLYRTGTPTKKFMVVFATNQPDQLDWAVNDRTDEMVEFSLPGLEERTKILKLYFNQLVRDGHLTRGSLFGSTAKPIELKEDVTDSLLEQISKDIEGFSGREINKMVISFQAFARGSVDCSLSKTDILQIVNQRKQQHEQRKKWEDGK